jgi:hypothetical protein
MNPHFSSNETLDCAFHVFHTWLEFRTGFLKVWQRPFSSPVSAPGETQDMAINDLTPAAVGEGGLQKSSRTINFSERCVKVGETLKIWKFLR